MHIILHQPEIPANTGNIGRTCVATGTDLHLIEPLGFQLNEKSIKRAGMDYWEHLNVTRYINLRISNPGIPAPESGWPPPRRSMSIRTFPLDRTIILCLEKKVLVFRRKF